MDSEVSNMAKLIFQDVDGYLLLTQEVEIKGNASYPVAYQRHGPKLTGPQDLGCWVKATGRPKEFMAGTFYAISLESLVPSAYDPSKWGGWQEVANWLYQDLVAINCAGPSAYPGPGMGWSMNFMPIRTAWCIPAHTGWLQAGAQLAPALGARAQYVGRVSSVLAAPQTAGLTSAQQRDAFLRAVFAPDVVPPTVRSTKYITPRSQRTATCPCGVHYRGCNLHDDWLEVD